MPLCQALNHLLCSQCKWDEWNQCFRWHEKMQESNDKFTQNFCNLDSVYLATSSHYPPSKQIPRHESISYLQTLSKPFTACCTSLSFTFFPMLLSKHKLFVKTLSKIQSLVIVCSCPCTLLGVIQRTQVIQPSASCLIFLGSYHEGRGLTSQVKTWNAFALSSKWHFVRYQRAYLPIPISLRQAGSNVARSMDFFIGQICILSLVSLLL